MLSVVDEHESVLQRAKEEHLQQLEEVKRATESSGFVFFIFAFNSKYIANCYCFAALQLCQKQVIS